MKQQKKPFFTSIPTSDNHRPFSIPKEDTDFISRKIPEEELKKFGFESQEEFNAFCYTDYCYKKFIETAQQSPYFNNTIFIFVGDHGVQGNAAAMYPTVWTEQRLNDEHIPLLFYAPGLLAPKKITTTAWQIDLLPTLAGMIHQPYTNKTLGRDLLHSAEKENAAFIIHQDEGKIGIVNDDFFYTKNLWINKEELVPVRANAPSLTRQQTDSF